MTHLNKISRIPAVAWEWPADHTLQFIRDNMPQTLFDVIKLIVIHVKNLSEA
jgi:hypothetical protein